MQRLDSAGESVAYVESTTDEPAIAEQQRVITSAAVTRRNPNPACKTNLSPDCVGPTLSMVHVALSSPRVLSLAFA